MNAKLWTALGLTAALLVTGGGAASAATSTPKATMTTTSADDITWAGYGDSNMKRTDSWVSQFDAAGFTQTPGYYNSGYTSAQVLAATPTNTAGPDLAVINVGTNDVTAGIPDSTVTANIKAISEKSGATHTLVLAVAPQSNETSATGINRRAKTILLNRSLTIFAMQQGYMFADPWAFQRAWDSAWGTGADIGDGTHPTTLVAGQVSKRMPIYMRQAVLGTTD